MSLVHLLLYLGLAVGVYFSGGYVLGRLLNRHDVVDSLWGLGFILVAWLALWFEDITPAKFLVALFVTIWGLRLFIHISSRNFKKKQEDFRYQQFRKNWGKNFWWQAYFKIYLLQGLLLLAISTATIASIYSDKEPVAIVSILGFIVWGFGIAFEALSDYQLQQFLKAKKPGEIMQRGLWAYSRHPNYFGEITSWWGAAVVAASLQQWWGIIGALTITLLITKVSGLPPLQRKYANDKNYQQYAKHTSALIPLPKR